MYLDCSCCPVAFWLGLLCHEYHKFPHCRRLLISRTQIADDTQQPSYWACRQENLKFPDSSRLLTGPAGSENLKYPGCRRYPSLRLDLLLHLHLIVAKAPSSCTCTPDWISTICWCENTATIQVHFFCSNAMGIEMAIAPLWVERRVGDD